MDGVGWHEEFARERIARQHAEVEEIRLARRLAGPMLTARFRRRLRAWAARKLFGFAVAVEREEAWRVVWDRLEAPRPFGKVGE